MKLTIDEEYALLERLNSNRREAKLQKLYKDLRIAEVRDTKLNPLPLHCVVCGEPMLAQRKSKQTCSNRCRLRFSRWTRAYFALPKKEIRRRDAEVRKRFKAAWAAHRAAAEEEKKRKPKRSLEEIAEDIKRTLGRA
jgi:hypothetical protein